MKLEKKGGLRPKLRFPEFEAAGEWSLQYGNEIFEQVNNKQHDSTLPILAITQEHGAIPRDVINYYISVTEKSIDGYKVVEVGDFIISLRSFQGGIEYSEYKGICSPAYIILRKKTIAVEIYFKQFFKTQRLIQELNKNLEGLRDGKMVSYKQFSELLLPVPSIGEQQKIADCLTSVDELITAEAQKIEALKVHKKGLLQQLFPANDEANPSLRFPEFREAAGWEIKKLEEFGKSFLNGGTPSTQIAEFWQGSIPWITGADVVNQKIEKVRRFITKEAVKNSATNVIKEGSLLVVTRTGVGKVAIAPFDLAISQDLTGVYIDEEQVIPNYLYRFFDSSGDKLKSLNQGTSIAGITRESLIEMKIPVPSTDEQQKIVDCLASLDELITAHTQKLEALKTHKKGLMQQLFPSPAKEGNE